MKLVLAIQARLRRRRLRVFESLLDGVPGAIRLLDVGGSPNYWRQVGGLPERVSITFLNLEASHLEGMVGDQAVVGDARAIPFGDKAFDVVYSNSVLEHVGSFQDQRQMAAEVLRVGQRYFVQAPNRYFPIEPHFLFPFFQYAPRIVQVWLLSHFSLGWARRQYSKEEARQAVESIRLLTRAEMHALFPGARIYRERILGLTKSFTAYDGWFGLARC